MPRSARKAHNQALFRHVNETIAGLSRLQDGRTESFICECHHLGCTELIELPAPAYAHVRDDPDTFLVLPGHEDREHETIVSDHGSYLIVRTKPHRFRSRDELPVAS